MAQLYSIQVFPSPAGLSVIADGCPVDRDQAAAAAPELAALLSLGRRLGSLRQMKRTKGLAGSGWVLDYLTFGLGSTELRLFDQIDETYIPEELRRAVQADLDEDDGSVPVATTEDALPSAQENATSPGEDGPPVPRSEVGTENEKRGPAASGRGRRWSGKGPCLELSRRSGAPQLTTTRDAGQAALPGPDSD